MKSSPKIYGNLIPVRNKFRYVRYTDDGCCLWEFLCCKQKYEGRCQPGYYDYDKPHIYTPVFKFCPFCGSQILGQVLGYIPEGHNDNEAALGTRRYIIEKMVRERREKDWQDRQYKKERVWWIQRKFCSALARSLGEERWENYWNLPLWKNTVEVKQTLERLRLKEDKDDDFGYWEYRAIIGEK